jgi:hypothetical protein
MLLHAGRLFEVTRMDSFDELIEEMLAELPPPVRRPPMTRARWSGEAIELLRQSDLASNSTCLRARRLDRSRNR